METKVQGKLLADILNGGNIACASLSNTLVSLVLRGIKNPNEVIKSNMVACCGSFIGPKDLELGVLDIKDIENKLYNKMTRCLTPFMYQNICIVPKREYFKLIINTRTAMENHDEHIGISKNGKSNETLIYSIEVYNPFMYYDIKVCDLDKYFDCYINNEKIRNISMKTLYRPQIKTLSYGISDIINNSVIFNIKGIDNDVMCDKPEYLEKDIRTACNCYISHLGDVDFNDKGNVVVGFFKSEIRNNLNTMYENVVAEFECMKNGYDMNLIVKNIDIYPAANNNATYFYNQNIVVTIDYNVCVKKINK